ncbi:MAG: CRTAC1 family protein, partial [Acidobacteriota bacterium]
MKRTFAAVSCACALTLVCSAQAPKDSFPWRVVLRDVAGQAGLTSPSMYGTEDAKRFILETNGPGVGFLDYDRDGYLDAFVLSGTRLKRGSRTPETFASGQEPRNRLYRNRQNGTFEDVTAGMNTGPSGWASGICAGDYDNDGWTDVVVTYYGQNVLLRNAGGKFEDLTARSGLASARVRWGSGCTFLDYDRDGDLDLFVANYLALDLARVPEPGEAPNCLWKGIPVNCGPKGLPTDTNILYRNNGDGSFTDVSVPSGIAGVTGRYSMTAAAADFDGDGWTDIYVASDSTAAILYRNNRDNTFSDVALESGAAYNEDGNAQAGMGVAVGDYNADGVLDILKTHFADDVPALYRGLGRMLFQDVATTAGLSVQNRYVQWGTGMPDLDNDGLPDLVCVTGSVYPEVERRLPEYPHRGPRIVFRNRDGSHFEDVTMASGPGASERHSSRGAAFGDFDNDGDMDVLVMNMNEPPSLLRNEYPGENAWVEVALEGTKSNRSAIGATILVTAGGRTQAHAVLSQSSYYSHDDLRQHFGLGSAKQID